LTISPKPFVTFDAEAFLPIPADLPNWRAARIEPLRRSIIMETSYGEQGEILWRSNDRPVPLDAFQDALMVPPAVQAAAAKAATSAFLKAYRKADPKMTAEERGEARAAFGAGTTVVNVITGRRTRV
jgi:hypothetical protein